MTYRERVLHQNAKALAVRFLPRLRRRLGSAREVRRFALRLPFVKQPAPVGPGEELADLLYPHLRHREGTEGAQWLAIYLHRLAEAAIEAETDAARPSAGDAPSVPCTESGGGRLPGKDGLTAASTGIGGCI